jgi:tetratricopeptide (TPR) repeat protein
MTNASESNRSRSFVASWLPWLLAAGMLLAYALTVNHGISPGNLRQIVVTEGLNWKPNLLSPLTFLVTYPLHWLPAGIFPLALNVFAAICAALTLALLARSVALLPHDRTYDQRQRELSEFSTLTIRSAWLPPVLAVLVCGLQLTFWEHATEGTGEMLDLLLFAYLIRCLLEFRIDQKASWLNRFALVYGLALANNWGMVGFIPCFLVAMIWIKGFHFFNLQFLIRMLFCWLAGLTLLLVLPLVASLSETGHMNFWSGLHLVFATYKYYLTSFPRVLLLLLGLTSVLPVFVIGIRWASSFGDTSPLGVFLATSMFHVVHALFLIAGVWVALDASVSPRHMGGGYPFLPFYYLGALSIGYFSGYFLLVFGTKVPKSRYQPPAILSFVNRCVVLCIWLLLVTIPGFLLYRNLPRIRGNSDDPLRHYFARLERALPPKGGVVLSDDPSRLFYLEALMNQSGRQAGCLLLDTTALNQDPDYLRFLDKKYPQFKLAQLLGNHVTELLGSVAQVQLLKLLSKDHELYYLHPSFGYYFEQFYSQPHGLIYELKPYAAGAFLTPAPSREQVAENQGFWRAVAEQEFPRLVRAAKPPVQSFKPSPLGRMTAKLRLKDEPDTRAKLAGMFYSRALNYWGVELQKSGAYPDAANCFSRALELNPDNLAAQVNQTFNHDQQEGKKPVLQTSKAIEDKFGTYRKWDQILQEDGPFDEPSFCYQLGGTYAQNRQFRQSIQQFTRVQTLAPESNARYLLPQLFIYGQDYSNALSSANQLLAGAPDDATGLFFRGISLIQLHAYQDAIPPLSRLMKLQTNNYAAQLNRAIAYLQVTNLSAARQDYETIVKVAPTAYQAYYGLAEIASREKDTSALIKNYQLYLTNAPPDSEEAKVVNTRLKELQSTKPDPR